MPASQSGRVIPARPAAAVDPADGFRQPRLALLLAEVVPGARIIRVSQHQPSETWPNPCTCAYDEQGQPVLLNRTVRVVAGRWVTRAFPEVNWDEVHDLDLATGSLRPTAGGFASSGGGR